MKRSVLSVAALLLLFGLTALTGATTSDGGSAMTLGGLAALKATVIGLVFLELDRARWAWRILFVLGVCVIALGTAAVTALA